MLDSLLPWVRTSSILQIYPKSFHLCLKTLFWDGKWLNILLLDLFHEYPWRSWPQYHEYFITYQNTLHIAEPIFVTKFGRWLCFCCFIAVICTSTTIMLRTPMWIKAPRCRHFSRTGRHFLSKNTGSLNRLNIQKWKKKKQSLAMKWLTAHYRTNRSQKWGLKSSFFYASCSLVHSFDSR